MRRGQKQESPAGEAGESRAVLSTLGEGPANATVARALVTRRKYRQHAARATVFVNAREWASAGELIGSLGADTVRVFMVGPKPGLVAAGLRSWAMAPLPAGWTHARAGHYLEGEHPTLRFKAPDGRTVELLRVASYFGDGAYSVADAAAAWELLGAEIGRTFGEARLLATPATTGRELVLRSIPRDVEWPVLPPAIQTVIRSHSGQGRIQLLEHAGELPGLAVYDGRFMYAALCWGLPAGVPMHDHGSEFLGQVRARYFVEFLVPDDWETACACKSAGHKGLGILPTKNTESRDGWQYPAAPGARGEGWYDGAELLVAYRHGWRINIRQRLVFPAYAGKGPLDGWANRLAAVRSRIERGAGTGEIPAAVAQLARAGVRSIVLHAIGALHGTPHRVTRMAPMDGAARADVPRQAENLRVDGDHYVWSETRPTAWPEMAHPEWSSAIWARARARLLSGPRETGALHVPAANVVAFRTDAVYLTARADWPDDGANGRLRLVKWREGPLPAPRSHAGLLSLRNG